MKRITTKLLAKVGNKHTNRTWVGKNKGSCKPNKASTDSDEATSMVRNYLQLCSNGISEMLAKSIEDSGVEPVVVHRPLNCINCGAALHGDTCEFCGTEYKR